MAFLREEDLEETCALAEQAARKYIFSRCRKKDVQRLNVVVSSSVEEEIIFNVEVDLEVSSLARVDVNELVEKAIDVAMEKIDERLREVAKRAENSAEVPREKEHKGSSNLSSER
ncbi:MAG: DUF3194 domain-containing protein [Candidatus Jordarchaeales archaeon]|nr:DUF3194 domain-containing protein [Candidatus Jordarchaeia archaeon]